MSISKSVIAIALFSLLVIVSTTLSQQDDTDNGKAVEKTLENGRTFLVSKQNKDGSFPINPDKVLANDQYIVGITALSILVLLGDDEQSDAVEKAVGFLTNSMDKDGYIFVKKTITEQHSPFFEHALATQALAEVLIKNRDGKFIKDKDASNGLKGRVQKAVQWIVSNQLKNGGWQYSLTSKTDEAIGAAFQLDALQTAKVAGIEVSEKVIQKGIAYLKEHVLKGGGFRCKPNWKVSYEGSATITAVLYALGEGESDETKGGLKYLQTKGIDEHIKWLPEKEGKPVWMSGGIQLSGIFYAALAYRRSGDEAIQKDYFPKMCEKLLKEQRENGSWSGIYGDVYGTVFTILLLETERDTKLQFFNIKKIY